ncbi:sugar ABC transporter substrate-binding protein, partial [Paenibacillus sp. LK1]
MGGNKKNFFRMGATLLLSLSVVLAGCSGSAGDSGSGEENSAGSEVGADNPIEISVFLNEAGQQP